MGCVVNETPRLLCPLERQDIHCIRGWVGHRAGPDRCGKKSLPPGFVALRESPYRLSYPELIAGVEHCFPTFLFADPVLASKSNLAHVNTECPFDRYTKLKIYISELTIRTRCVHIYRFRTDTISNQIYCHCVSTHPASLHRLPV
jgi:hypothetical protein